MTHEDFIELERVARLLPHFDSVGVFSPLREREGRIFPGATALPRWRWDLNRPGRRYFDLLVAANVFMYAPDPARWFRHVLKSCRYFLLQDVIRRRRTADSEFGRDGDQMRYAVPGEQPRTERFFDLASFGDRLLGYRTYYGGANEVDEKPLHVIALFRGDRAEPTLRIDDYPTGIRPLLPDLAPLNSILEQVESCGLEYHLGIVPALLTDEMFGFLSGLTHMIPSVHGYDHAYPKYAPLLIEKGDPYNQHTAGVFNEFRGQPYEEILSKLTRGRLLLEDRLGRVVTSYIPPCNKGDRRTGRALAEAGFRYYLSEKRIPGCPLPMVGSDLYGRSPDYDGSPLDVATLHVTWEWDVQRQGNHEALPRMLDGLRRQKAEQEALTEHVRAAV